MREWSRWWDKCKKEWMREWSRWWDKCKKEW
jgi:hypothetical protein